MTWLRVLPELPSLASAATPWYYHNDQHLSVPV